MTLEVEVLIVTDTKKTITYDVRGSDPDFCYKSGSELLTSYVMVLFVSVTSQDLNL
jgi:hypothetical protein